jgi:nucleoside-diphosphate kinase
MQTIGIIKPEAIEKGLVSIITERIEDSGLTIESSLRRRLTSEEFDLIYGRVQEPGWLHDARRDYLTSNEVIFLKITGEDAIQRLLIIRGSSNPRYASAGTLRGDFARDQDYDELGKQKKIALNIFHACDTEEEARTLADYLRL